MPVLLQCSETGQHDEQYACTHNALIHTHTHTHTFNAHTHNIHLDEGVYVNSSGGQIKDVRLQWGEVPSSIGE